MLSLYEEADDDKLRCPCCKEELTKYHNFILRCESTSCESAAMAIGASSIDYPNALDTLEQIHKETCKKHYPI